MKLRYLPLAGALVAASLTVAACGAQNGTPAAAAPAASHVADTASAAAVAPAGTAATAQPATATPAAASGSSSDGQTSLTGSAQQGAFANALAAWKAAASAPVATMNGDLAQAAGDLRASGDSGYGTAVNDLTYLANLPATNVSATAQSEAQADVKALDSFFGTPGLMS